ncbi:MAG: NIL domain-containing protein, partial [Eubacteriales bacterium]
FNGAAATGSPLIARMAVERGIEANIVYASTKSIGGKVYGSMLLGIPSEESQVQIATEYLTGVPNVAVQVVTTDVS